MFIVGKASPNPSTGDIEYFLRDLEQMLSGRNRFVYPWDFNPDERAIEAMRATLGDNPLWLFLAGDGLESPLQMRIIDFHHDRDRTREVETAWTLEWTI